MANVLIKTAVVQCPHQFPLVITGLPAKSELTVDNIPVLTIGSTGTVTGCTNPPASGGPCTAIASWAGGSLLLDINGEAVLMDTSVPTTNIGPGRVQSAGQMKLETS